MKFFKKRPVTGQYKKSVSDLWPIISRISVGLKSDSQELLFRNEMQDK